MEEFSDKKKKWIFVMMVVAEFSVACVPSLLSPFLPAEAEKKGVTPSQYGVIFSIDQVACLICAPFIGANLVKLGAKFVLCSGLFIEATCCCLFGVLAWCPGPTDFLLLAYAIRIMEGIGSTCFINSSLSMVTVLFQDSANEKRSILASVFTVAMIVSPSIGGVLYYYGGFAFPFLAFGGMIAIGGVVLLSILPNIDCEKKSKSKKTFKILMKSPLTWLPMFSEFSVTVACATYEATLEPHIRQFHFLPVYSSLFFVISPAVTAVLNKFSGSAIDKGYPPRKMMILGSVAIICAYSIIGPLPFLPLAPTPYSVAIGLGVLGAGIALSYAAAFGELFRVAKCLGLDSNQETNGVVTSIWQSTFSFGFIVGPILSGTLLQHVGFRWETLLPICTAVSLLLIVIPLVLKISSTEKEQPILSEQAQ